MAVAKILRIMMSFVFFGSQVTRYNQHIGALRIQQWKKAPGLSSREQLLLAGSDPLIGCIAMLTNLHTPSVASVHE
ncbi:hypothetical protein ACRRTK_018393 [Alexandromys fortis]